ncbi:MULTISPECIES: elongation factor P maturation arginine rhamnosyltransferase EarP [Polaromonas]|uniref:Protein-arginine rhamnosyltransferase n=1 Tax=Polaromonas aquatica TaxID=332657 RepID=A0ABW1U1W2_9BURK
MNRSLVTRQWDIFCKVIDNFGDIGICWRLAADLASRGQRVRLWVDDASALAWMAPTGCEGVRILPWREPLAPADLECLNTAPTDVLVEAFGCEIATEFIATCAHAAEARGIKPVWINLEYLSAEVYAERNHALPSPVLRGPAAGWTKWFFYPGFTAQTGGLLHEPGLAQRQAAFDRAGWLNRQGLEGIASHGETLVSLFCYEPPALASLLRQWADSGLNGRPVHLLVAAGRAHLAVKAAIAAENLQFNDKKGLQPPADARNQLSISYLPLLTQVDFDHLLWACDLNFVRGEDSIVRALWAGKPFVWHIYPQDDDAHRAKLDAFLDMLGAPPSLRAVHHIWNTGNPTDLAEKHPADGLASLMADLPAWQKTVLKAQARHLAQEDLTGVLLKFVEKTR